MRKLNDFVEKHLPEFITQLKSRGLYVKYHLVPTGSLYIYVDRKPIKNSASLQSYLVLRLSRHRASKDWSDKSKNGTVLVTVPAYISVKSLLTIVDQHLPINDLS